MPVLANCQLGEQGGIHPISDLAEIPAKIDIVPARYFAHKKLLERPLAAVLLIVALPLIAVLALLVRLTSPGSGIFRQTRVGRNGVMFEMYKIRTMRHDAEHSCGPAWTQTYDPRVTLLGRVLRKLHLDELPQLFNVFKGEMSLIGPRPERPEFVLVLADAIPGYVSRLAVLPGITGLAQINLPPDSDLNSVRRKLDLDLIYVREASLFLDMRMFLCTLARLFGLSGETVMRLFQLRRTTSLPDDGPHGELATVYRQAPVSLHCLIEQMDREQNGNGHCQPTECGEDAECETHEEQAVVRKPR